MAGNREVIYLIIGASKGLGAALVDALLEQTSCRIVGIARTPMERIQRSAQWSKTGRYRHVVADISLPASVDILAGLAAEYDHCPLRVIFNAASVSSDFAENGDIDPAKMREINKIGVDGLANVLAALQPHLLANRGVLAGISSFSACAPPIVEPRVAYPASKAYLEMVLRSLRIKWKGKVVVTTIRLGHLAAAGTPKISRFVETYDAAARMIACELTRPVPPEEIGYPVLYKIFYQYLLPMMPDRLYAALLGSIRHSL